MKRVRPVKKTRRLEAVRDTPNSMVGIGKGVRMRKRLQWV
jgi:hypothetical protein